MRRWFVAASMVVVASLAGCANNQRVKDNYSSQQTGISEFEYFNDMALDPIKGKLRFFGSKPVVPPSDLARYPTPQEMAAIKILKDKYETILSAYIEAKNKYGGLKFDIKGEDAMYTRSMLSLLIEGSISMNRYNEFKFNNDMREAIASEKIAYVEADQKQKSGDGARQFLRVLGAGLYATGKYFETEQARREAYKNSHPNFTCYRNGDYIFCNSY